MGKLMRSSFTYVSGLVILLFLLNSCNEDPYAFLSTNIEFEVSITSDPVYSNYMTVFSTDVPDFGGDGFTSWYIEDEEGGYSNYITPNNSFIWRAPADTGTYNHTVRIFSDFGRPVSETKKFKVKVVPSPWVPAEDFYSDADLLYVTDSLYLRNTTTNEERLLGDYQGAQWFPDGERIMALEEVDNGNALQIVTMYADGTNKEVVYTNNYSNDEAIDNVSVSPSGRYIIFNKFETNPTEKALGIFRIDLLSDNFNVRFLNQFVDKKLMMRDWSPDEFYLLVQSGNEGPDLQEQNSQTNIQAIEMEGFVTNSVKDSTSGVRYKNIRSSKNGAYISFLKTENDLSELFVSNPAGAQESNVTDNTLLETTASWSPDSEHLVFAASDTTSGQFGIYTIDVDGNNEQQIVNTGSKQVYAVEWRPVRD